jgi:hypothetical protein
MLEISTKSCAVLFDCRHDAFKEICKKVCEKVHEEYQSKPRPGGLPEFLHAVRREKIAALVDKYIVRKTGGSTKAGDMGSTPTVATPAAAHFLAAPPPPPLAPPSSASLTSLLQVMNVLLPVSK